MSSSETSSKPSKNQSGPAAPDPADNEKVVSSRLPDGTCGILSVCGCDDCWRRATSKKSVVQVIERTAGNTMTVRLAGSDTSNRKPH